LARVFRISARATSHWPYLANFTRSTDASGWRETTDAIGEADCARWESGVENNVSATPMETNARPRVHGTDLGERRDQSDRNGLMPDPSVDARATLSADAGGTQPLSRRGPSPLGRGQYG
jgi:hypothetical protein